MPVRLLFPTPVYTARLRQAGWQRFNRELVRECYQVREQDAAGRRWSARNYPRGYTSYGSLCHLQKMSSTFHALERLLRRHVTAMVRALDLDLGDQPLVMTDCWINILEQGGTHSSHLHPRSTLSGTYYVRVPRGSPGLKLEDPRLDRFMAAPSRRADAVEASSTWVTVPAETGKLVLFESWMRHEVPPNPVAGERVSISFNYNWF